MWTHLLQTNFPSGWALSEIYNLQALFRCHLFSPWCAHLSKQNITPLHIHVLQVLCLELFLCVCVWQVHKWVQEKKHPWNKNDQEYILSMTSIKIYLYDPACLLQVWKLLLPVFVLRFVHKLPHGCSWGWIGRKWVHIQRGRSDRERHYQWRRKQQLHQTAAAAREEDNCKRRIST